MNLKLPDDPQGALTATESITSAQNQPKTLSLSEASFTSIALCTEFLAFQVRILPDHCEIIAVTSGLNVTRVKLARCQIFNEIASRRQDLQSR